MMGRAEELHRGGGPAAPVQPGGFVWAAVAACLLYAVCHALGWREYAAFLSGSAPASDLCLVLGIVYVVAYFGFVLARAILLLAAGIFAVLLLFDDGLKYNR